MTDPTRRQFVAAGATLATAATAGCNGILSKKPMLLRALPADGNETDIKCKLSQEFVSQHPKLERVLTQARKNDDWAKMGVSIETGTTIGDALAQHCDEETRGLYRYDGQWYFISLRYRDTEDHQASHRGNSSDHHENSTDHDGHDHTH